MNTILCVLAAMFGSLSFTIMFSAPRNQLFFCSLVGGIGWLVNDLLLRLGIEPFFACFGATLTLTALSRLFSFARKTPLTVFLIAGIFPLVPGSGVYFTARYLFANQYEMGLFKCIETFKYAGAIALGILFGLSLPPRLFRWAGRLGTWKLPAIPKYKFRKIRRK